MPYQKVTFLEDLPDVGDMDDSNPRGNLNPTQTQLSRRFIRKSHSSIHPESGMAPPSHESFRTDDHDHNPERETEVISIAPTALSNGCQPTCQEVYYHIQSCPLCTKFYKTDNTIYLGIIFVLLLVCAVLAKKLLS